LGNYLVPLKLFKLCIKKSREKGGEEERRKFVNHRHPAMRHYKTNNPKKVEE